VTNDQQNNTFPISTVVSLQKGGVSPKMMADFDVIEHDLPVADGTLVAGNLPSFPLTSCQYSAACPSAWPHARGQASATSGLTKGEDSRMSHRAGWRR